MGLVQKFQLYLLLSELKKELNHSNRIKKFNGLDSAKTIGIIYQVGEEKDQIEFTGFVGRLQSDKKEVKALGIVPYKNIPHYCYPKLAYDYITTKNLNWFKKPTGDKVKDFIDKEFDILINFDTTNNPTLTYIAGMSKAFCKAGMYKKNNEKIYDLMLENIESLNFIELSDYFMKYINMFSANVKKT